AEATLEAHLRAPTLDQFRVDHLMDLVVIALHHADAEADANLGRSQARARGGDHRLGEVVEQAPDGVVHPAHPLRLFTEDRLVEVEDGPDHEIAWILPRDL